MDEAGQSLSTLLPLLAMAYVTLVPGSNSKQSVWLQANLFAEFLVLIISPSVQLVLSCYFLSLISLFYAPFLSCPSKGLVSYLETVLLLTWSSMVQLPTIFV